MQCIRLIFLALAACSLPLFGRADVIFSDLGPGDSFLNGGALVGAPDSAPAFGFTPTADYILTGIELALAMGAPEEPPGNNQILAQLSMDCCGGAPGSGVAGFGINLAGVGSNQLYSAAAQSGILLLAGQQYWIQLFAGLSVDDFDWDYNDEGVTGPTYYFETEPPSVTYSGTGDLAAFAVLGSPVPEPNLMFPSLFFLVCAIPAASLVVNRNYEEDLVGRCPTAGKESWLHWWEDREIGRRPTPFEMFLWSMVAAQVSKVGYLLQKESRWQPRKSDSIALDKALDAFCAQPRYQDTQPTVPPVLMPIQELTSKFPLPQKHGQGLLLGQEAPSVALSKHRIAAATKGAAYSVWSIAHYAHGSTVAERSEFVGRPQYLATTLGRTWPLSQGEQSSV